MTQHQIWIFVFMKEVLYYGEYFRHFSHIFASHGSFLWRISDFWPLAVQSNALNRSNKRVCSLHAHTFLSYHLIIVPWPGSHSRCFHPSRRYKLLILMHNSLMLMHRNCWPCIRCYTAYWILIYARK